MLDLNQIKNALAGHQAHVGPLKHRTHAAVALIVREHSTGPEVLFIERARHEEDPWSGDLGFPGGRVEPGDGGPRRAAERETSEEIGLVLNRDDCLGRLDDISGAHLPVLISCFVYRTGHRGALLPNHEVNRVFWVPLRELTNPRRHAQTEVQFGGRTLTRPALDLLGGGNTVLWGITYRLVAQFLDILGHPLPGRTAC